MKNYCKLYKTGSQYHFKIKVFLKIIYRHPNILKVQLPLIDTGKEYVIVTEPILCSLSNFR
jgi:hypothetical protein